VPSPAPWAPGAFSRTRTCAATFPRGRPCWKYCAPGLIRTGDLLLRKQARYPAAPREHYVIMKAAYLSSTTIRMSPATAFSGMRNIVPAWVMMKKKSTIPGSYWATR
jgi:hypothetical protein